MMYRFWTVGLSAAVFLLCSFLVPHSAMAQLCALSTVVDYCGCELKSDSTSSYCEATCGSRTDFACNNANGLCQTLSGVCSSNDTNNCTVANGCNPNPCSPATCGTGGPVGSCPSECRQGSSCGAGYSGKSFDAMIKSPHWSHHGEQNKFGQRHTRVLPRADVRAQLHL